MCRKDDTFRNSFVRNHNSNSSVCVKKIIQEGNGYKLAYKDNKSDAIPSYISPRME